MVRETRKGIRAPTGSEWKTVAGRGYRLHVDLSDAGEPPLEESVRQTLRQHPPWLHCRWLYDEVGSELYERITEQPEYYLTRTEDRILADNAEALFEIVGDVSIVELGSGSSMKTRRLLETWLARGETCYVPIDISESALEAACASLAESYPDLAIDGLAARYARGLPLIGGVSPLLLLFLGSTIGNFNEAQLDQFLQLVAAALNPGDRFLLGIDLVKDAAVLNAAYNDAAGWTERFMVNVLERMNREMNLDIPLDTLRYEGSYNEELERVEMFVRFTEDVDVRFPERGDSVHIAANQRVMIEISCKFHVDRVVARLEGFGFSLERCFTDSQELFAVLLLTREE